MERIHRVDPQTGVRVTQLTSFPVLSHTLYYHCPCFTPDGTLVFLTYNGPGRWASPDAWRVNLDGTDLWPITRREGLAGFVVSPDGSTVYAQDGGALLAFPISESMTPAEPVEIGRIDGVAYAGTLLGSVSNDGTQYLSTAVMQSGETAIVRYATDGSDARIVFTREWIAHLQLDPATNTMLFGGPSDGINTTGLWLCEPDGSNLRPCSLKNSTGHYAFFGTSGKLLSTVNEPYGSIVTMSPDGEIEIIARGGHFWHAAGSADGKWVVSDTNWPDIGIVLVNVDTGRWAPLCQSGASHGHPQWTHPHPMFSPDGNHVVFTSDRTGIGQVYAVEIPGELRQRLGG